MSRNLGASTSCNPQGLSRPVMGLLFFFLQQQNQQQWAGRCNITPMRLELSGHPVQNLAKTLAILSDILYCTLSVPLGEYQNSNLIITWSIPLQPTVNHSTRHAMHCHIQHLAGWQGLDNTKRQAQELISGPSPAAKTRLLSFDRIKSWVNIVVVVVVVVLLLLLLLLLLTATRLSPGGSGYFPCIHNMKLVTNKFKTGGLHDKHVEATWNVGNHLSVCL